MRLEPLETKMKQSALTSQMNQAADEGREDAAMDAIPLSAFAANALEDEAGLALYWLRRKIGRLTGETPAQGTAPRFLAFWQAEGETLAHFGDNAIALLFATRLRQGAYAGLKVAA